MAVKNIEKDKAVIIKKIAREMGEEALQLVYPRVCPLCGKILRRNASGKNPYICRKCYDELNIPEGRRCLKCSRPLTDDSEEICDACKSHAHHYNSGISLMLHDDSAKKILYDLKYANNRDNADMLAYEAAEKLQDILKFWQPDVMIPIPLHKDRFFKRGFNQAELLSKRLSEDLKESGTVIPVNTEILKRTKNTSAQKTLGENERRINMQDAFEADQIIISEKKYKSALIVDDIYTSGATVSEAAGVLKMAGLERVHFLTFSIV